MPTPMTYWRSRGYIPHFSKPGLVQSIAFRLCDAVPEQSVDQWKTELRRTKYLSSTDRRKIQLHKRITNTRTPVSEHVGFERIVWPKWFRTRFYFSMRSDIVWFPGASCRIMFMQLSRQKSHGHWTELSTPGNHILHTNPTSSCTDRVSSGSASITTDLFGIRST
jgi:hypothetical protein